MICSWPGQIDHETLYEENPSKKGLLEWLRCLEHLPSKHEAPNSKPTAKSKKEMPCERKETPCAYHSFGNISYCAVLLSIQFIHIQGVSTIYKAYGFPENQKKYKCATDE
jgi:hypothetical protein